MVLALDRRDYPPLITISQTRHARQFAPQPLQVKFLLDVTTNSAGANSNSGRRNKISSPARKALRAENPPNMTSLKRSAEADPLASNISSKTFVRSTRKGKVQKIVREVYLRQDIPCSSKIAPKDASGNGKSLRTQARGRLGP